MDEGARLLELQEVDLALDRLAARAGALEQGQELAAARDEADSAEASSGEHRLRLAAMDRDGTRLEHEIDSLRQKSAEEERRLYDGSIANAKELEALQREVDNLRKRISDREDEVLAMLEQRQEVEDLATVAASRAEVLRARLDEVAAETQEELDRTLAELDDRRKLRASLTQELDTELVELYEDLRRLKKGVGAAALIDGVCQGCHEQLSAVELDRLRRTEGLRRCEHCRRILVL